MLTFRPIEIKDREWITKCLKMTDVQVCEYTFVNNYIWSKAFQLLIAEVDGFYCSKSKVGDNIFYSYPAGSGDIKSVIEKLMQDAKENNISFILKGITKFQMDDFVKLFPDKFKLTTNPDESDYLYSVEKLSKLAGKKLHGKRNHIARFKDNPDWVYEDITMDNLDECFAMNQEWCRIYNCSNDPSLNHEKCAVKAAFDYFEELGLKGGLLRLNGRIIAYTMGSEINEKTFDIHIEKAFGDIQGAYPMINQQFVLHNCQGYEFVNREEDLGDEGLRKAKSSYYPDMLMDKYTAEFIGN